MTTVYRAIGKVPVNASVASKQAALYEVICDAVAELHDLGMSLDAIYDTLADAHESLQNDIRAGRESA